MSWNISCNNLKFYREVGTIVRALGCYPSEADLADIIAEVLKCLTFYVFILCVNVNQIIKAHICDPLNESLTSLHNIEIDGVNLITYYKNTYTHVLFALINSKIITEL